MNKIGLIGGISPWSTAEYYKGIINGYRKMGKDDNYRKELPLIIKQDDFAIPVIDTMEIHINSILEKI